MDYARKKVVELELRAVRTARHSPDLNVARAAIEREEELRTLLQEMEAEPEESSDSRRAVPAGA